MRAVTIAAVLVILTTTAAAAQFPPMPSPMFPQQTICDTRCDHMGRCRTICR